MMSDRCGGWKVMLSRDADGDLNAFELTALETHLAICRDCRQTREAHLALRRSLRSHEAFRKEYSPTAFDAGVLAHLQLAPAITPIQWILNGIHHVLQLINVYFLKGAVGGAITASCATGLLIYASLHTAPVIVKNQPIGTRPAQKIALPVSLQSLIVSPAPSAALLWKRPGATDIHVGHPAKSTSGLHPGSQNRPINSDANPPANRHPLT